MQWTALVLSLPIAVVVACPSCLYSCDRSMCGKTPFDAAKFAGEWLIVVTGGGEGPLPLPRSGISCFKGWFPPVAGLTNNNSITLRLTLLTTDGQQGSVDFVSEPYCPGSSSKLLSAWRIPGENYWGLGLGTIIATDYDCYALIFFTKDVYEEKRNAIVTHRVVSILARTATCLSKDVLKALKQALTSYGFHIAELRDIPTSGC